MQDFLSPTWPIPFPLRVISASIALVLFWVVLLFIPPLPQAIATQAVATEPESSVARGLTWLKSQQATDGSFPGFSAIGGTADGIYALAAGGEDPHDVARPGGSDPIEFLKARVESIDCDASDRSDCSARSAGQVAVAAEASSDNPKRFGGSDLIAAIEATFDEASGSYRETKLDPVSGKYSFVTNMFDQAFAVLGLSARHVQTPRPAISNLLVAQQSDGGWEFSPGWGTDTNSTALALQALIAARRLDPRIDADAALVKALEFFHAQQNADGGFAYQKSFASNYCGGSKVSDTNSTAYSTQALLAAGEDPAAAGWVPAGAGPVEFLLSVQNDDGSFNYQQGPDCSGDAGATSQAIPAVAGESFVCLIGLGTCPVSPADQQGGGSSVAETSPVSVPPSEQASRDSSVSRQGTPTPDPKSPPAAVLRKKRAPRPPAAPSAAPVPSTPQASPLLATSQSPIASTPTLQPGPSGGAALARAENDRATPLTLAGRAAAAVGAGLLAASIVYYMRKRKSWSH
ncbi:MAG: hypothetical protein ACR2FO_06185 [Actinomycetota bacterium]